jgi:membrane associated rhomboid family serine protease
VTSFLPDSIQGTILLVSILIMVGLAFLLPWKKKGSATAVISTSVFIVFMLQLLFTSDMVYDLPFLDEIDPVTSSEIYREVGFHPRSIIDDQSIYQFITSTYLHADFLHLIFNFLGLFLLGIQLERKIGWLRFLMLYFGSGIIAGGIVLIISPFDAVGHSMDVPSIGASGCIFGIIGGYWFLYPKDKVFFPLPLFFIRMTNKWPISLIFLIYGGITAFFLVVGTDDNTSHIAHFGGLVGAFPIAALIRPPEKEEKIKELKTEDLASFAKTRKQKEYLKKAMEADEEDVRNAWLDELFQSTNCPKCRSSNMSYENGKAVCPRCGHRIKP